MSIEMQQLQVEGGALPLTVARAGGQGAAVVIIPAAFGVGPDLVEQMGELVADACVVVTFDPFFREDPGFTPYDDMARVMGRLQGLDRERGYRDVRAVIEWTRQQARGSAVVGVGVCFGGPYALLAAADGLVDGVVTWHGSRMDAVLDRAPAMRCPMRLHFGAVDPVVPPATVAAVRQAFAGREDVRVVVHEGATHGFSHRAAAQAFEPVAEAAGMAAVRELVGATRDRT